jgi:hypothetical protein
MDEKLKKVVKYWGGSHSKKIDYAQIDQKVLREFTETHPDIMKNWLPKDDAPVFRADPEHILTGREKKHRLVMKLENLLGLDMSKKHFRLIK